jgi:hypothetical protein
MDSKTKAKETAQFWEQELEVMEKEASRSEIDAGAKGMAQFWQREASRSEIVACAKGMAQFWQREASRSEIVAFVTELVNQNRRLTKEVNQNKRLIKKIKQFSVMRDKLCSGLEDLAAERRGLGEDVGQTAVRVVEEDKHEALALSVPITEVSDTNSNHEGESLKADEDLESEFATMIASKSQTGEGIIDSADRLTTPASPLDDFPLFHGEVEIAMAPPVDTAQLIRFQRNLRRVPRLNVSCTSGSRNGWTVITVLIAEPRPLISTLRGMPEVGKVELRTGQDAGDDSLPWGSVFDSKSERRQESIVVTLNHSEY